MALDALRHMLESGELTPEGRRRLFDRLMNEPIITGVDYGAGESFTAWSVFNKDLAPGQVHYAGSILLEKGPDGVWSRRRG